MVKGNYRKGQTFVERERIPTGMKNATANQLGDWDMLTGKMVDAYDEHSRNVSNEYHSVLGIKTKVRKK